MTVKEAIETLRKFLDKDTAETPVYLFTAVAFACYVLASLTDEQRELADRVWAGGSLVSAFTSARRS